jgi:hypothetical protein
MAAAAVMITVALGASACGDSEPAGDTESTSAPANAESPTRVYRAAPGDTPGGQTHVTQVRISNDADSVRLVFRFSSAPPLRNSVSEGWTDMLLMGIDVPPIGPGPTPNGWTGLDYALGMHGVDARARFRAMEGATTPGTRPDTRTLQSQVDGRQIAVTLPRAWIGNPAFFEFNVVAAREGADESSGGGNQIPAQGTARYTLR